MVIHCTPYVHITQVRQLHAIRYRTYKDSRILTLLKSMGGDSIIVHARCKTSQGGDV